MGSIEESFHRARSLGDDGHIAIIQHDDLYGPGNIIELADEFGLHYKIIDRKVGAPLPDPHDIRVQLAVVLGGDASANDPAMQEEVDWIEAYGDRPFLGICLGEQLLAKATGGKVRRLARPEIGFRGEDGHILQMTPTREGRESALLRGVESVPELGLNSEGVVAVGSDTKVLARGNRGTIEAIQVGKRRFGVQRHTEAIYSLIRRLLSEEGQLERFDVAPRNVWRDYEEVREAYDAGARRMVANVFQMSGLIELKK